MELSNKIIFEIVNDRIAETTVFMDTVEFFYGILFGLSNAPGIRVTINNKTITYAELDDKNTDYKTSPDFIRGVSVGHQISFNNLNLSSIEYFDIY